ncbi:hypothetical protein AB205_0130600, partial [Aquarana catesbeiana]
MLRSYFMSEVYNHFNNSFGRNLVLSAAWAYVKEEDKSKDNTVEKMDTKGKHVVTCSVQWICTEHPGFSSSRGPTPALLASPSCQAACCEGTQADVLPSHNSVCPFLIGSLAVIDSSGSQWFSLPKANQECESLEMQGSRGHRWNKRGLSGRWKIYIFFFSSKLCVFSLIVHHRTQSHSIYFIFLFIS